MDLNKIQKTREQRHLERVKYVYRLDPSDYFNLLEKQKGLCAICGKKETKRRKGLLLPLSIDHCHKTNEVRGLLCHRCNVLLGNANDSIEILKSAINYLEKDLVINE